MIKIDPKKCERMIVSCYENFATIRELIVVAKIGNKFLTVDKDREADFLNDSDWNHDMFDLFNFAKPIPEKKSRLRTRGEILSFIIEHPKRKNMLIREDGEEWCLVGYHQLESEIDDYEYCFFENGVSSEPQKFEIEVKDE